MKLFERLLRENEKIWKSYIEHNFVKELEKGTLKQENFLFYLKQDYMYLLNYAKCYSRLCLNARNSKEAQFATKFQNYIIEGEIELHKSILKLGVKTDELSVKDESIVNLAYTRYILSVGDSGDYLDILVALSSCAIGYAYIGKELIKKLTQDELKTHPYKEWILTYSSQAFQDEAKDFEDFVNSYSDFVDEVKFKRLSEIFYTVTRCEVAFWQHSLEMKLDI